MDNSIQHRQNVKHAENSLYQELIRRCGLCSAQADTAVELMLTWAQTNYNGSRPSGQIVRTAVAADEPAGKPVVHCRTKDINLTIDHRMDGDILQQYGTCRLREVKVLRLSWEAYEQGALLSHEDLANILGIDRSSVGRMVKTLHQQGLTVPTRGVIHDMGRAPSHKEQIGRLLCRGYTYTEVTVLTGHTERSIERYALALGAVIMLADQDTATNDIRIICDLSEAAVNIYLNLYKEHNTPEFRQHLDTLKRRFESGKGIQGPGQYPPHPQVKTPVDRLKENTFTKATSICLQEMLDLTEPIANQVAEKISDIQQKTFCEKETLEPGQTILLVDSSASAPKVSGKPQSHRPLVPVVLSPWTPDKYDILSSKHSPSEKRALIADALAREAQQQGGTMTVSCLAVLLGISTATMATALANLRQHQDDPTPIKGITEDAGPTQTHKDLICNLQDQGFTPPEISVISLHEPQSRDRYLKMNLRIETLIKILGTIPDEVQTARFLNAKRSVVKQYLQRFQKKLDQQDLDGKSSTAVPVPIGVREQVKQTSG